ncbi:hypothetical protein P154DRAFT_581081 [Amniculicola lignicola CBS 123094]|uniref:Uncharacterized protein n=1 Tax=Amniculicola lignicola CBS 123094 TaxID=1392246 RepID=A0A6A5W052_9PLEO|nr:hypothetical protein P154DRAFT_581081 [Amniculicola lignicola CBS 123094]
MANKPTVQTPSYGTITAPAPRTSRASSYTRLTCSGESLTPSSARLEFAESLSMADTPLSSCSTHEHAFCDVETEVQGLGDVEAQDGLGIGGEGVSSLSTKLLFGIGGVFVLVVWALVLVVRIAIMDVAERERGGRVDIAIVEEAGTGVAIDVAIFALLCAVGVFFLVVWALSRFIFREEEWW